jgi:hypothetical protein
LTQALPRRAPEAILTRPRTKKSRRPDSSAGGARPPGPRRSPQFAGRREQGGRGGGGPSRTLTGVVSANRAGFGFVRSEEHTESVFLPPREIDSPDGYP